MSSEANKDFIRRYLDAVSGKPKPKALLDEYITDEELKKHVIETETAFPWAAAWVSIITSSPPVS